MSQLWGLTMSLLCPQGSKVVIIFNPPRTEGGRCSSSPQSRSPSPQWEQLPPPPWPGPPPCYLLPGIPAPRTLYGPAWHAWRPWRRLAPVRTRSWNVGSVLDSPPPTCPERSRWLGPAQPSRTREEMVKKGGQPGPQIAASKLRGSPGSGSLSLTFGTGTPAGTASGTQIGPAGYGGTSCQLGFRALRSGGGGA